MGVFAGSSPSPEDQIDDNSAVQGQDCSRDMARKIMATVFWNKRSAVAVNFMAKGTTVDSDYYSETLSLNAFCHQVCPMRKMCEVLPSMAILGHTQVCTPQRPLQTLDR
jgi:hypothetical protein